MLVKQRNAELVDEADRYRLARGVSRPTGDNVAVQLRDGMRSRIVGAFVLLRTALSRETPCNDPCPDCA